MDKVCKCGKGYVSHHDGKCGHCRTKYDKEQLDKYFKELEEWQQRLRLKYFNIPVPPQLNRR